MGSLDVAAHLGPLRELLGLKRAESVADRIVLARRGRALQEQRAQARAVLGASPRAGDALGDRHAGRHLSLELGDARGDDLGEEVGLAAEVAVEGTRRAVELASQVAHRGARVPVGDEPLGGELEQAVALSSARRLAQRTSSPRA